MLKVYSAVRPRDTVSATGVGRVVVGHLLALASRAGVSVEIILSRDEFRTFGRPLPQEWEGIRRHQVTGSLHARSLADILFDFPRLKIQKSDDGMDRVLLVLDECYFAAVDIPTVVMIHDVAWLDDDAHPTGFQRIRKRLRSRLLLSRLVRSAAAVLTVSEFSRSRILKHEPRLETKIYVVPNFLRLPFSECVDSPLADHTRRHKENYIFLPGGLSYRKNAQLVVDAWGIFRKRAPETRLVVSGVSDAKYISQLQSDTSVEICGFTSDEELLMLYQRAAVVWLPSRYEGFGMSALEAMSQSTPIVASDIPAVREVCCDAVIRVPPDDGSAHIEALIKVLTDDALRAILVSRGLLRVSEYSMRRSTDRLIECLKTVGGNNPSSRVQ